MEATTLNTQHPKQNRYATEIKLFAVKLYLEGLGYIRICQAINQKFYVLPDTITVRNWIKKYVKTMRS